MMLFCVGNLSNHEVKNIQRTMFGPGDNVGEKEMEPHTMGWPNTALSALKLGSVRLCFLTLMHCMGNLCQNVTMYFDSDVLNLTHDYGVYSLGMLKYITLHRC